MDKEEHKQYIDFLKEEINKRDNKDELNKKMILSEDGSLFIHSYRTTEEHEKLIEEIGQEGIWFYPIASKSEIKRILSPKSCKDILLNKRATYIADHSRTRRVFLKRKEIYEKRKKEWSLSNFYSQDKNFENYLKILKPYVKQQCKSVEAGFVFMVEPNGICEKTEFGNIIYLSESLSYFLHFMNFAMIDFNSFEIEETQQHESLLIALRVMLGVESLDFDLDPRYDILPQSIIDENNAFVYNQLMFIIGHEYAHHSLGHLKNSKMKSISYKQIFKTEDREYKVYNYSQKQEFEADWYSFKNTKLDTIQKEEMLNGAFSFFIYLDIFNYVKDYIFPSGSSVKTHPEPLARLWKLRRRIKNNIGYKTAELNKFIEFANSLKQSLAKELLPYKPEVFEFTGSIYLSKYKTKRLIDRIDF